ncbi:MAG TPA: TlpA disulfide reductase family protein [Bryobacteraceae bacterium]|nr:TlpA disulfide reductase family protein [Bryobacteraceae bacterium]
MLRILFGLSLAGALFAQQKPAAWTDQERPVAEKIRTLRNVPDSERGAVTKQLALRIRKLPLTERKLSLAEGLANLSTEGDFGRDSLQEVATTLWETLREPAAVAKGNMPEAPYLTLAQLIRYEHVQIPAGDPLLAAAMARLESEEQRRQQADFTLTDLQGHAWSLRGLKGKVVLVNFWATWCPPCRKEMPDLDALYRQFHNQGLVILAISDEEKDKVEAYLAQHDVSYPILLDPGDKVNKLMAIEGIPKSFVYNRDGKLVAQSIDMRTRRQFLEMLAAADLR